MPRRLDRRRAPHTIKPGGTETPGTSFSCCNRRSCRHPTPRRPGSTPRQDQLVVKGVGSAPFWGFLAARLCVAACRGQPRWSSLRCGRSRLTAAACDEGGSDQGIPWLGPAARLVAGLVPDHRVGDLVARSPSRSRSPRRSCRGPAAASHSVGWPGRHAIVRFRGRSAHAAKPRCPLG